VREEEQRELVCRILDRTGLSLSALATEAKLSHTTLTRWWKARGTLLSQKTIRRLLDVSPERDTSALDRDALFRAINLTLVAAGLEPHRAPTISAATITLYQAIVSGEGFTSDSESKRAAKLAVETADLVKGLPSLEL
jgi:hypothetical protein